MMIRPEVLHVAFPYSPDLQNWTPPLPFQQEPLRLNGYWIRDGDTGNYKLTGTDFYLVFVPIDNDTGNCGNWCITHKNDSDSEIFSQPLYLSTIVNKNDSPAVSMGIDYWTRLNGVDFGPVSCKALTDDAIRRQLDKLFSSPTPTGTRFQEIEKLLNENVSAILPWVKKSLPKIPEWIDNSIDPLRHYRYGKLVFFLAAVQFMDVDDSSLFSASSESSPRLARALLWFVNHDWNDSLPLQANPMMALYYLCEKQDDWKQLARQEGPRLLEYILHSIRDNQLHYIEFAASRLLSQLVNEFEAQEFKDLPDGLLAGAIKVIVDRNEFPELALPLERIQNTLGTWAEGLSQAKITFLSSDVCSPPDRFICAISMHIMVEPVFLASGETYDRSCISKWLHSSAQSLGEANVRDPGTNVALNGNHQLTPNNLLAREIRAWVEEKLQSFPPN